MVAVASLPPDQVISTEYAPRARRPFIEPSAQADGRAGSRCSSPFWLCRNISPIPAMLPKLPSIWKGGWVSNRFGRVDLLRSSLYILYAWSPSRSLDQKHIFQALLQPVPPSPLNSRVLRAAAASSGVFIGEISCPGYRPNRWDTCRCCGSVSFQSLYHSTRLPAAPICRGFRLSRK